jgi:sugar lactone lactonase YvrE
MKRVFIICAATWAQLLSIAPGARAQNNPPLRLVQTIAMPNVKGRIDHLDVDLEGKRLFVAGIENGTMEVLDLNAGKWMRSITGFKTPTEMCYVRDLNKLFVASRDDGNDPSFSWRLARTNRFNQARIRCEIPRPIGFSLRCGSWAESMCLTP